MVAVTHYYKFYGLKTHTNVISYSSGGLKSKMGLAWLKSRIWQAISFWRFVFYSPMERHLGFVQFLARMRKYR